MKVILLYKDTSWIELSGQPAYSMPSIKDRLLARGGCLRDEFPVVALMPEAERSLKP